MAVTSGFFNSLSGDRKYDALQMGRIFDGIIEDGVYQSIGDRFKVTATTGMGVTVGSGRAWFNHTWTYNDADIPLTLSVGDVVLNRIDTIVLEVDTSAAVRNNSIKILKGTVGSSPVAPALSNTPDLRHYRLANVYVKAGATSITQADITNMVGTEGTPYIIGALQKTDIDNLVAQWGSEFDAWFSALDVTLEGDVAANLAAKTLALETRATTTEADLLAHETAKLPYSGHQRVFALGYVSGFWWPPNVNSRSKIPIIAGLRNGIEYTPEYSGGFIIPHNGLYKLTLTLLLSHSGLSNVGASARVYYWRNGVQKGTSAGVSSQKVNLTPDTIASASGINEFQAGDILTLEGMGNVYIYGGWPSEGTNFIVEAL